MRPLTASATQVRAFMSELLFVCVSTLPCLALLRAPCLGLEVGKENGAERSGAERSGAERSGLERDGTGRDGTGRDGTRRDATRRDATQNGERDGERSGGTERVRALRLDAPIPRQRALPYITGAVA
jgi:hypothetical protein